MPFINNAELREIIDNSQRPALVEPSYKRKYIPLGLAKIAGRFRENNIPVVFSRSIDFRHENPDVVFITSVFTHDSRIVDLEIKRSLNKYPDAKIVVGGVYASLEAKKILGFSERVSLFHGYSKWLDSIKPDYSINWYVKKPWDNFSYLFTTRGCKNKCSYCAVKDIEPGSWINPKWKELIERTKMNVMVYDNNLTSMDRGHYLEVFDYLAASGKRVIFDNGFDCKHITPEVAHKLSRIKYHSTGIRIAFDRISDDGVFQRAVKMLLDAGVSKNSIMAYVLFNFKDKPQEAHYRMCECAKLGIKPYPQKYEPLTGGNMTKKHVGKHWTPALSTAFRSYWFHIGNFNKYTFEEWAGENKKLRAADWGKWNVV